MARAKVDQKVVFELLVGTYKDARKRRFTASRIAKHFDCNRVHIHKIIKGFLKHGLIVCDNPSGYTKFYSAKIRIFNPLRHTVCTYEPYALSSGKKYRRRIDTLKEYNWTETQKKMVYGELLGDGYISRRGHFKLTSISKEHTLFLKERLPVDIFSKSTPYRYISKDIRCKPAYILSSRLCKFYYQMRHKWYPLGFKIIPNYLCLDPTICYHWFIGDGYFNKKHNYVLLSTDCFLRNDVDFLVSQLIENGILARRTLARKASTITIKKADLFLEWIGPNKISDYNYKWGF